MNKTGRSVLSVLLSLLLIVLPFCGVAAFAACAAAIQSAIWARVKPGGSSPPKMNRTRLRDSPFRNRSANGKRKRSYGSKKLPIRSTRYGIGEGRRAASGQVSSVRIKAANREQNAENRIPTAAADA